MKKKLRRYSYYSILLICMIYVFTSLFLQITYYDFDPQNVKNNIEILTSEKYAGRLTGSTGNYSASILIENTFKDYKLKPFDSKYRESFDVITPVTNNNTPSLTITSNGKVMNDYSYGNDFKENMLNFKSSEAVFTKEDNVEILTNSIIITQNNKKYLFKVNPNKDFSFRSSFNYNSQYDFCINITTELYNDILNSLRNNCEVCVKLPYATSLKTTSNIVGVIKGTSPSLPPLILTAHYDHLGVDALGNYYNGALDNASGTAFLLELSKNLSSLIKPQRDIIFVALTGEEFGLLGSKNFVANHLEEIKDADVINFDMIGAENTPLSFIIGSSANRLCSLESSEALNFLESQCIENKIEYDVKIQDSSDHASFNNAGINALTICYSDVSRIHTPKDTINYIDSDSINQVYAIVKKEIYNCSYNKYLLFLYNPIITGSIIIISISLIVLKNHKSVIDKSDS
ncbi:M28 family metallopeptidase [uncultured Clostridium sp.]|uniref:M28 family metallopeptidase n=1 Tax=uncultured Clostridium sp. TaxID=59620 RepID=UPI0025E2D30E|nr:M28 family metallopeptidase [uncultured Clostridium sp.]